MTRILVIGHADSDGHVIAEQTRRNLAQVDDVEVSVVVDPNRTQGHRSWLALDRITEIASADIVLFVDMMFSPVSFVEESEALVAFVERHPSKLFLLIDHHPLPERRLARADNLHVVYRPDVFECTVGPRSGLMVLAALCENQYETVRPVLEPHHELLARGLRLAAAHGSELPGTLLMTLLSASRWDLIAAIAEEPTEFHRLIRGRRPADYTPSGRMLDAIVAAKQLEQLSLKSDMRDWGNADSSIGRGTMPFDIDDERYAPRIEQQPLQRSNAPTKDTDLESLVTLLEVAALSLTDKPDATFTREQLVFEMRSLAGAGVEIDDRDVSNVFDKASFIQPVRGKQLRLK